MQEFSSQVWYSYLTDWQQELVETAEKLLKREKNRIGAEQIESADFFLDDYAFIVFPMAKAYEGFLKKYFFDFQLIDKKTYFGKRFRVGRALNPDVRQHQRDKYWIFDDVVDLCGVGVARDMWETWLECRNRVFHFYPDEKGKLSIEDAEKKLAMMAETMTQAVSCMNGNRT
jgi:hypothetical protein